MIKAIIIEDEINSRELLQQMLTAYCKNVHLAGSAVDVPSGIELIKQVQPELVFLDVEIPGGTGFDILNAFENANFKVIFVTGYEHYAIKAIKYAAIDYILKPINLDELVEAVAKITIAPLSYQKNLAFLKDQIDKSPDELNQFILSGSKGHRVIKIENIIFVEAERTYVTFHMNDDQKYVAANPLNFYEDLLPDASFFRIHKSYIINCKKVVKLENGRGGPVHLNGGAVLPVAFRRKPAFVRFLDGVG